MENENQNCMLNPNQETHICRRCGRKLKTPESQKRGMGNTCFAKWSQEDTHKQLFTTLQTRDDSI